MLALLYTILARDLNESYQRHHAENSESKKEKKADRLPKSLDKFFIF